MPAGDAGSEALRSLEGRAEEGFAVEIGYKTVSREGLPRPGFFVASSPGDVSGAGLSGVNFDKDLVVAVSMGQQTSGGYEMRISRMYRSGSQVTVVVDVERPSPGAVTTMVLTHPGHVVKVPKSKIQADGLLTFKFVTADGHDLATVQRTVF